MTDPLAELQAQIDAARADAHAARCNTTLTEYLALYQKHCAHELKFDPTSERNTKGDVAEPDKRLTPEKKLGGRELFPNEANIIGARPTIREFLITSEHGITRYVNAAEIPPVIEIVCQYVKNGGGDGQSSLGVSYTRRGDPEPATKKSFVPVDGVWNRELHWTTTGKARRSFESKPIIQSPHPKNDCLYTVLAVFTQVFDYMITSGTPFAYVDTGMARVFFQICRTEPTVLYYGLDVSPKSVVAEPRSTAVCPIALFLCHCLTAEKVDRRWITTARESNCRWVVDPEAQLDLLSSHGSTAAEMFSPSDDENFEPNQTRSGARYQAKFTESEAQHGLSRSLDRACHNVDRHSSSSSNHELSAETLFDLLRNQLSRSRDHAMDYLKIRGGIGHLFRVSLCSHGYTFGAKAIRVDHVHALTREYAIYGKLQTPYILPFPHILTHLLLLSYSGPDLLSLEGPHLQPEDLRSSAEATLKKLQDNGLQHCNVRKGNILWNTERSRVFMVDFEEFEFPGVPAAPPPKRISDAAITRLIRQTRSSGKREKQRVD
ncbi:hypothetical protein BDR22DRAFT_891499 [Usnea florida]